MKLNKPFQCLLTFKALCLFLYWTLLTSYSHGQAIQNKPVLNPSKLAGDVIAHDDNLLIVNPVLMKLNLPAELFIYSYEGITLIPLQPFFDALDFPINVNPETEQADGWFISESNTFSLSNQQVHIKNIKIPATDSCLYFNDGFDYYASTACLQAWFPLDISLHIQKLKLNIHTNRTLPLMAKLKRQAKRNRIHQAGSSRKVRLIQADQYQWISYPVADFNLEAQHRNDTQTSAFSTRAAFDVLKFQTQFNLNYKSNSESSGALTFSKKPNHPDDTFALGINAVSAGDIYGQSDDLISSGGAGVGISFGAHKQSNVSGFSKRIIEGNGQPGWEVELYRNNSAVDFTTVSEDGRYRFEDVSVDYGENIFDIKIYGPQGQFSTRRESISVGNDMLKPGHYSWQFTQFEKGKTLIDDTDEGDKKFSSSSQLNLQYGLTERFGIGLKLNQQNNKDTAEVNNLQSLSLLSALPGANLAFEMANSAQGQAYNTSLQGYLYDYSTTLDFKIFDNFISERNAQPSSQNIKLSATGRFKILSSDINHSMFIKQQSTDYNNQYELNNRFSTQVKYGFISHTNTAYIYENDTENQLNGEFKFNSISGQKYKYRLTTRYDLIPKWAISTVSFNVTKRHSSKTSINTEILWNELNDSQAMSLSASHKFNRFLVNHSLSYDSQGDYSILANISFSLSGHSGWTLSNQKVSNTGQVRMQAFLDRNNDGLFNQQDEPLEDIQFKGLQHWPGLKTNEQGNVVLTGLSARSPSRIAIAESSLPDPFWQPLNKELHISSHAGAIAQIPFAITETIEVEAMVYWQKGNRSSAAPGVPFELVDENGEVVAVGQSEFDGILVFTGVPTKQLKLNIPAAFLKKMNMPAYTPITVNTSSGESLIYLEDIVLTRP